LGGDRILVTGSNGFIGSKVVEKLLEYGFPNIRCFVRPSSKLGRLESALRRFEPGRNIELITGDLLSRDDCRRAAEGVSIIYHLAAGMEKSFAGAFMNSALATRNVMDAFSTIWQAQALCECQFVCCLFQPGFETWHSPG
jgi:nucleoside-diphosphate-sugar epimerase